MTKKEIERTEALVRIIVFLISGLILYIWKGLILILMILNLVLTIFNGKRNKELAMFSEYWNTEFYKFIRYMTFVSNQRPFPFTKMERISKFS